MARKYELKRRAQRQEETRQRIIDAAVELHSSLGPARTSISAIAERAGVQRLTVYRHFPDERSLFRACSGQFARQNPPPDPATWRAIVDPEERLRRALPEIYAYYERTEPMMVNVLRDLTAVPVIAEIMAEEIEQLTRMRDILARGWGARGPRRTLLLAALGHALDFQTWRSLARQEGLRPAQVVDLMAGMVSSAVRGSSKHGR